MKKLIVFTVLAAGLTGCAPKDDTSGVGTETNAVVTTNQSTGTGQAAGTVGEGAARTGDTNAPLPPSGAR